MRSPVRHSTNSLSVLPRQPEACCETLVLSLPAQELEAIAERSDTFVPRKLAQSTCVRNPALGIIYTLAVQSWGLVPLKV